VCAAPSIASDGFAEAALKLAQMKTEAISEDERRSNNAAMAKAATMAGSTTCNTMATATASPRIAIRRYRLRTAQPFATISRLAFVLDDAAQIDKCHEPDASRLPASAGGGFSIPIIAQANATFS
jgi:hypothetical protein